ncbi:hypothetical protein MmiAt1_11190 [Methanimicrococcus sp. At1]|uniref:Type I restriction modification DNA specificity domain-containing protein n=1 Tax=Methanimicrococcus hacksteinii TaxID=3028293 RepID=A0ABU3VQV3_9EURY|nr:restriction endonuclease subunit S [Methanimicrococcus sp. At1]MDV0445536.1 hypothetical protein [Methanimicrococcus sp. At1]
MSVINDYLEQIAQAIYKSWFVDFEPFKDDEFVESEFGLIPKGWKIGTIDNICDFMASGGTPSTKISEYYCGNIKWFSTKELRDSFLLDSEKHITPIAIENSSAKIFPKNTILMAIYAAPTVGRLGILIDDSTFNQAAVGLKIKENIGYQFAFLMLYNLRDNFNNLANGAAQQNLNVSLVKNYKILIPSANVLKEFKTICEPIFDQIEKNELEKQNLIKLRDSLLPKLMSGELSVENLQDAK